MKKLNGKSKKLNVKSLMVNGNSLMASFNGKIQVQIQLTKLLISHR